MTICTVSMNGLVDVTGRMDDIGISGLPGKKKQIPNKIIMC